MPEFAFTLLAFCIAYVAFALLALSQPRHLKSVAPELQASARTLRMRRLVAATLLLLSLALALGTEIGSFGAIVWPLLLSAAGFSVAQTLAWKPVWLRWLLRVRL